MDEYFEIEGVTFVWNLNKLLENFRKHQIFTPGLALPIPALPLVERRAGPRLCRP